MKSNKEIINMHMRGNFEQLSKSVQDAILSAMNESNSEACLNYELEQLKNKQQLNFYCYNKLLANGEEDCEAKKCGKQCDSCKSQIEMKC